jgi:hypothetical protein
MINYLHPLLKWLHDTGFGAFMREVPWAFPVFQGLHFIGMTFLFGAIGILDLRVLGFAKGLPLRPLHRLLPLGFLGFGINLFTGIGFFCSDPYTYVRAFPFQIKMLLVLLAGLNALWFWLSVNAAVLKLGAGMDASPLAKVLSLASLIFWVGVAVAGRFIAFSGVGTL